MAGGEAEKSVKKKNFLMAFLAFFLIFGMWYYRRYQYMRLDVLEFRLSGIRLELPCTIADIEMCGYHVNDFTGECDKNEIGLGTIHITQDEKGRVCEIYTDDIFCDLEIYGNIDIGFARNQGRKKTRGFVDAIERIEKLYGEPEEEDDKSRTYIKYKSENEYAYITIDGSFYISRLGIVAGKSSSQ